MDVQYAGWDKGGRRIWQIAMFSFGYRSSQFLGLQKNPRFADWLHPYRIIGEEDTFLLFARSAKAFKM